MARSAVIAAALMLAFAACPASARLLSAGSAGQLLFDGAFNPDRNFAGDLEPSSDDQLILTAAASVRDDYIPGYSLAIAYECYHVPGGCRYVARILRVGPGHIGAMSDRGFALLSRVREAESPARLRAVLESSGLQWLEADLSRCEGGIAAMDSIRIADWRPDVHHALVPVEQRDVILHPAMIRVRMSGSYATSRYEGWVLASGVPAAVARFLEVLEPCWFPSPSRPPWRRSLARKRRG